MRKTLLALAMTLTLILTWVGTTPAGSPPLPLPAVLPVAEAPAFSLELAGDRPSVGSPMTVKLTAPAGFPAGTQVRWNLAGAPFTDAGIRDGNPATYSFVPREAGSFLITAQLHDARGNYLGESSLEVSLGRTLTPGPEASALYVQAEPEHPRIGQATTLTFRMGPAIPEGCRVQWHLAGGVQGTVSGRHGEVFTFVPTFQTGHSITARLHRPDGSPMGEVALAIYPVG